MPAFRTQTGCSSPKIPHIPNLSTLVCQEENMIISQACELFDLYMASGNYSDTTRVMYRWALRLLISYLKDPQLQAIKPEHLDRFWAYLRHEYVPTRMNGKTHPLSGRSLENIWTAQRSFFSWCIKSGKLKKRPDLLVDQPKYAERIIQPFTPEEVNLLIKHAQRTRPANTDRRSSFTMPRSTAKRDTAIIMLLADTGMRVSECARLRLADFDIPGSTVTVQPFGTGRKTRQHTQSLSKSTNLALMEYKLQRGDLDPDSPFFITIQGNPMNKDSIRGVLSEIGRSAGIPNVHPHRFRHFFLSMRAADGAGEFVLTEELGLTTTKTARHYVHLEKMKRNRPPLIMDRVLKS